MQHVLLADDQSTELQEFQLILEEGNFVVWTASTPDQAINLLHPGQISVAVIDYRLNGGGSDDDSGLRIAQDSNHQIPKILISAVADGKQIRAAFGVDGEGRQIVFSFLDKEEIRKNPQLLIKTVNEAIEARRVQERKERESVSGQLLSDYNSARRLDSLNTVASFVANFVFIALLVVTVVLAHAQDFNTIVSAIVSIGIIVSEVAVNLLLAKRLEGSSRRAESYHAELLQAWRFEQLVKSAGSLDYIQARNDAKQEVISAFANRWNRTDMVIESSKKRLLKGIE